jgi:hypothetical protein
VVGAGLVDTLYRFGAPMAGRVLGLAVVIGGLGLVAAASAGGAMLPVLCARRLLGSELPAREGDGVVLVLADPAEPGRAGFG